MCSIRSSTHLITLQRGTGAWSPPCSTDLYPVTTCYSVNSWWRIAGREQKRIIHPDPDIHHTHAASPSFSPVIAGFPVHASLPSTSSLCSCCSWWSDAGRDTTWCRHRGLALPGHRVDFPVIVFMRESSYCFQRVLAIAILSIRLSVRHTGGSVKFCLPRHFL